MSSSYLGEKTNIFLFIFLFYFDSLFLDFFYKNKNKIFILVSTNVGLVKHICNRLGAMQNKGENEKQKQILKMKHKKQLADWHRFQINKPRQISDLVSLHKMWWTRRTNDWATSSSRLVCQNVSVFFCRFGFYFLFLYQKYGVKLRLSGPIAGNGGGGHLDQPFGKVCQVFRIFVYHVGFFFVFIFETPC